MILNLVYNQKNKLNCTTYSADMTEVDNIEGEYGFRDEIELIITEPVVRNIDLTLFLSAPSTIRFVDLEYSSNFVGDVSFYYSLDNITWRKFNYYKFSSISLDESGLEEADQIIIEKMEGKIIKIDYYNNQIFSFYTQNNIPIVVSQEEYEILYKFLNGGSYFNLSQIFLYDEETPLFDVVISGVKVEMRDCIVTSEFPFIINNMIVESSTTILLNDNHYYPSLFYKNMFKPKYFEEYNFMPNLTKTFLEMLESDI